jgi:hypothetical protein
VHTAAFTLIEEWRSRLDDQLALSSSEVQNRLFDLYGELEDHPSVELLKPWLTLTVRRELFGAEELRAFLDELTFDLNAEVAAGEAEVAGELEDLSSPVS